MTTERKPRSEYTGTCADLPNNIRLGNCEPTEQMTTQRIAELEAEVMRLREALEHLEHNARKSGANMGLALDAGQQRCSLCLPWSWRFCT